MTEMFTIAMDPDFHQVIDVLRARAIAQKSNISAVTRDILYKDTKVPQKKSATPRRNNRSAQLSRKHSGRR